MIKLQYPPKPVELTNELVKELTNKFKQTGDSVWQQKFIKEALLKMSFDKCCFCEGNTNEESKYVEIEHFHPKSKYDNEVVLWENLLPICKRCNTKKGDHDTKLEPIINPAKDNPKEHLYLRNYWFYPKTPLGKITIDIIYLNDKHRLKRKRSEVGDAVIEQLHELFENVLEFKLNMSVKNRNKIIGKLKNILIECCPNFEYSATAATTLLSDPNYKEIKALFEKHNLWSNEFKDLEEKVEYCALL
jgi:hypothetical protein